MHLFSNAHLVVDVTVGKHCIEVLHTFAGTPVVHVLQPFLDGAHVHRILDYLVIVLTKKRKGKKKKT